VLPGGCQGDVRVLSESGQGVVRVLSVYCQGVVRPLQLSLLPRRS